MIVFWIVYITSKCDVAWPTKEVEIVSTLGICGVFLANPYKKALPQYFSDGCCEGYLTIEKLGVMSAYV